MTTRLFTIFFLINLLLFSCVRQDKQSRVFGIEKQTEEELVISSVIVQDNQIILLGSGLNNISSVLITGSNGFAQNFYIESQTRGSLVANSLQNVSFDVGSVFNISLSGAYSSVAVPISFDLEQEAVTSSSLSDMGANNGQILKFDGTNWVPEDMSGLLYAGNWDADANSPNILYGGDIQGNFILLRRPEKLISLEVRVPIRGPSVIGPFGIAFCFVGKK